MSAVSTCVSSVISLRSKEINDKQAESIAEILKAKDCSITALYLENCKIGPEGIRHIADALKENRSISILSLSSCNIDDEGLSLISAALKVEGCSITTLRLYNNKFGAVGAGHIAMALKDQNCSLSSLDLSANDIGPEGTKYIALAICVQDCSLTTLHLTNCNIRPEGAWYISQSLKINSSVTILDLGANGIFNEGAEYIAEGIKGNSSLATLNLSSNTIESTGARHIAEALKANRFVTTLKLDRNYIGDEGASFIAESLKTNSTLLNLSLYSNGIEITGIRQIISALELKSCSITYLNLGSNKSGSAEDQRIGELLFTRQSNKRKIASSLLGILIARLDQSEPLFNLRSDLMFSQDNYERFSVKAFHSLYSDAEKYLVPSEYSPSLANLYKLLMSEHFPSFHGSVPHAFQEGYNSLSPNDKILIDNHIWRLSGMPSEEDYGSKHVFDSRVKFYAAVHNAILSKYEEMSKIQEQKSAVDRNVYKLALFAGDPVERVINDLAQFSSSEAVFADEWGAKHAKENLMRLVLAMAMAERVPSSSMASSSSGLA